MKTIPVPEPITATRAKQIESLRTLSPDSRLWVEDPAGEDKSDKETPRRTRFIQGDLIVLVEAVEYVTFGPKPIPKPGRKAKKRPMIIVHQYRVHLLHSKFRWTRTLKVYKHGRELAWPGTDSLVTVERWLYLDGNDYVMRTSAKGTPTRDRDALVRVIAQLAKVDVEGASRLLRSWTDGH